MDQGELFDLPEGRRRKDAGQTKVATGSDREQYMRDAELFLWTKAPRIVGDEPFQMERLYEWVGAPPTPYLMGALTTRLIKSGMIVPTGRRAPMAKARSHARKTELYRLSPRVLAVRT